MRKMATGFPVLGHYLVRKNVPKISLFLFLLLSPAFVGEIFALTSPGTYQGSLIDAHSHVPPEEHRLETNVCPQMDQAGVTKIVLMGHQPEPKWEIGEDDKLTLRMYESYPNRVIPFLCCIRWGQTLRDPAWIKYADQQLATGKFKGVGQLTVKRYVSHDPKDPDRFKSTDVPWDSPWAQNLVRLVVKHNVPLMFMMETTPETLLSLDRFLQQNPNVKLIWNHQNHLQDRIGPTPEARALSGDPQRVDTLMQKYPNLFIDLTIGRDAIIRANSDRQIPENWRNLYEKYVDRIIIGVDIETERGFERRYLSEIDWVRSWISQLSSDTAKKKLAYENIERILTSKPVTTMPTRTPATTVTPTPTSTPLPTPTSTPTPTTVPSQSVAMSEGFTSQIPGGYTTIAVLIVAAITASAVLLKRRKRSSPP